MRLSYLLSSTALGRVAASICCEKLQQNLGDQVSFPEQTTYKSTLADYWSLQESELEPSCIIHPSTSKNAAQAVFIISSTRGCKFAIKSGGHAPAAGFANIKNGVTIDMTSLASVTTSHDHSVVHIGAGAKWLDVYRYLDPLGVSTTGGRNGNVGVGGLLLGGGISHFATERGWASDNVINYEVILADGSMLSANATSHPDLFRAMKGGGNNFGLVTRFDLATFPQGNLSVTSLAYDISQRQGVFEAFTNIVSAANSDDHTSLVTGLLFNSTSKQWRLTSSAVYTKAVEHPEVFKELEQIPNISNTTTLLPLSEYADESPTPPLNWAFQTATFKADTELLMDLFEKLNRTLYSFNPPGGVTWSIALEPLSGGLLPSRDGSGGDSFGLDADETGFIVLLSPLWPLDESRQQVERTARTAIARMQESGKSRNKLLRFQYLNYAGTQQKPFESYGHGQLKRLQAASYRYDPEGVFQHRVPGGFKLYT